MLLFSRCVDGISYNTQQIEPPTMWIKINNVLLLVHTEIYGRKRYDQVEKLKTDDGLSDQNSN